MINHTDHISQRYSPLFTSLIDFDADKLLASSKTTFFELLSSPIIQTSQPIRFVKMEDIHETHFDSFYEQVEKDVTTFSQSFALPSYEQSDATDPNLSPYPNKLGNHLHYPSQQSDNPPWFQTTFSQLSNAENFLQFNFCDQPLCIIYISVFGKSSLTVNELRPSLVFPPWMKEFVTEIPIFNIILFSSNDKQSIPAKNPRSTFSDTFYLPFSENSDHPLSNEFIANLRAILNKISTIISLSLSMQIQQLNSENEKNLQLKNRVKQWIKKKSPNEKVTQVMNIPYRKIIRLQLGCYLMIEKRYKEARKIFKKFIKSTKELFPEIQLLATYLMAISSLELPEGDKKFKDGMNSILLNMTLSKNPIFLLYVSTIASEIRLNQGNLPVSIQVYRDVIRKMNTDWKFIKMPDEQRDLFIALYHERLAGIYMQSNLKRKSLLSTAVAALNYNVSNQFSHSLRCLLWIIKLLPHEQWKYLYQSALLAKAEVLCRLEQGKRAIEVFNELLSMEDLSKLLQQEVISEIWSPFNDPNLKGQKPTIRLNSLLKIKKLELLDYTKPAFWGFDENQFDEMIDSFNHYFKQTSFQNATFADWFKDDSQRNEKVEPINVPVNSLIYVNIWVYNRYVFSIHLDKANLIINYYEFGHEQKKIDNLNESQNLIDLNESKSQDLIDLNESKSQDLIELNQNHNLIDVNETQTPNLIEFSEVNLLESTFKINLNTELKQIDGLSTKKIVFSIQPLRQGVYTIEKFFKNYWGYADTEIELGSLTFSAIDDLPQIEMNFIDFQENIAVYSIQKFYIEVKNTSHLSTVNGFYLFFNCSDCLHANNMSMIKLESNYAMIEVTKELKPNQTEKIEFLLRTLDPTKYALKFMIAPISTKTIVTYAIKSVQSFSMVEIKSTIRTKRNDIGNHIVYCCLKGTTSGINIYGIINKQGKFIKSINMNKNENFSFAPKVESFGQSWSIIGLSNEVTNESCENWRTNFFSNEDFALLFQFPDNKIPAQAPIVSNYEEYELNVKIEVPPIVFISLTQKAICKVRIVNPIQTKIYFIKPLPIAQGESENVNCGFKVVGCKWVGITSTKLSKENDFMTEFSFVAFTPGIFHVSGFCIADNGEFKNKKEIKMMQSFRVDAK